MSSRFGLLGAAAVIVLGACHTVRAVSPTQLTPTQAPDRLWVTLEDQSVMALDQPLVNGNGDTLTGMVHGEPQQIPLANTTKLEANQSSPVRTAVLITAAGAAFIGGLLYMESRPDVGDARYCSNSFGNHPMPFTPCCTGQDPTVC
ncbi:MAG TPA: hypothetical protein VLV45_12120 [Gemmatimonadales bacterium]|nr:hypothetical protein [Gemmatimonadales bacterium]